MRFREVFQYELQHTLRSGATWIYPALLFFFAAWMLLASYDESIDFNAPIRLTHMAVAASMFGLLVTAGLFGAAAVRDVQTEMDPLLFTTPLSKTEYLGGRFLAALSINAVLLLAIPIGQVAAALLWHRFEPEIVGPYRITVYLQTFPLLLFPGLLFSGGILFTIAMLARQVIPVYLGAIVLFISGIVAANYVGRITNPFLSALADPFGIATLERMSRYWTPVEYNVRLVGFPAPLVWSRVAWLTLAAVALATVHRRFRFAHDDGGGRRKQRRFIAEPLAERTVSIAIPRVQSAFAGFAWVRQTLAVGRRCFAEVTASRSFVAVLLLAFGLTLLWGWNVGSTAFDTPVWPVTHLVASVALSSRNLPIIFLIIALWAGEMVWQDRDVGMAEIADATPVSEGVAVLGRFLAVVATLALLTVVIMAAGFTLQALQGYYDVEPGIYFRILFGINFANYVLWAALAMTIHVIVNQKYIGHILMLTFFAFMMASSAFGIDHHLVVYSTSPEWTYSEMNGFGPFVGPFVWFKLYWAAWALLLSLIASALWVRGREPGLLRRLRVARERFGGGTARAAAVAILLILVFGGFIFYNTNVLNEYRTPRERGAPQAEYEKRYKRFEAAPQPTIVSAELRMEIYPEDPAVETRGTFRMVNRTGSPIDSVHVYTIPEIDARSISFDRAAESVLVDDELGFRIYALAETLQPGDSLQFSFDVARRPRGFPNDGIPTGVVENGAFFNRSWLPMIGYQPAFELSDARARDRFGLATRPPMPSATDSAALHYRHGIRNEDAVRVEAVIGTAADQVAITPGVLKM
ncbi:MAG: ABC transporter permease, partial [Longimicrobiales bacterium]